MTEFTIRFTGRQKGAIGIFHRCKDIVIASDEVDARLKLYDRWEHITQLCMVKRKQIEGKLA